MTIIRVSRKLLKLLNTHQKLRIVELFVLMLFGALMETLTVLLFSVFVNYLLDPDTVQSSRYLQIFSSITGIYESKDIIIVFAIGLAILYIVKNIYTIWEYGIQYGFVMGNNVIMQDKILDKMIHKPYEYFLYSDSGEMIRFATSDISAVYTMLSNLLGFYTEFIVSFVLMAVAMMEAPVMSLGLAGILILSLLIVMRIIRPKIRKIGSEQRKTRASKNKSFIEIIEGIKEIKVMRREDFFRKNYYKHAVKDIKLGKRYSILSLLPKNIIESATMAGVLIVTAVLINMGRSLDAVLSSMALMAMVAVRLLPSVNRISSVLAKLALDEEIIDNVSKIYSEENLERNGGGRKVSKNEKWKMVSQDIEIGFEKELKISNLSYSYPHAERMILSNVSLRINKGDSIGVIGESGGGKSTLISILLGLLPPVDGDIYTDGKSIFDNRDSWLSHIGYVPQSIFIIDEDIRENIAFGVNPKEIDDDKVWRVIKAAALDEYVKSQPDGIYSNVGERGLRISGGQRQRIGIARALYFEPEIIFFDEATSALDVDTEAEIMESINRLKGEITMVIVAHRYTTVMGCDRIWCVQDGNVVEMEKEVFQKSIK